MAITIISTGGTIASTASKSDSAEPTLTGDNLVESVPKLKSIAEINVYNFSNVPSTHFTIINMYNLLREIQKQSEDPNCEGIIITQGTDILEETAYFVDLCYDGSVPVIFTGAMRNPSLVSPDGPRNLMTSALTIENYDQSYPKVLVAFNDRVHNPREVTKMNTMNTDTFRSPEFGPLAVIEEDRAIWRRQPTKHTPTFSPNKDKLTNEIMTIYATADMPRYQIVAAKNSEGVCLATTGAGHIPPKIISDLDELGSLNIPMVATSRCIEGRLAQDTYGFKGSETTLQDLGFYFSDLNIQKSRIKLIVSESCGSIDDAFSRF